jgi:hypothetical protein
MGEVRVEPAEGLRTSARRERSHGVRAAAVFAASIVAAMALAGSGLAGAHVASAQAAPAQTPANQTRPALPARGPATVVVVRARPPGPCTPGGQPAPNEPFCRSAAAAERSASISRAALTVAAAQLVGMVGQIFFLILTLRDSNRASRAATKAAAIASRQAEIAERGTETQLRAYVLVDGGAFRCREGEEPVVRITIKNYGPTPAFSARAWVHSRVEALPLTVTLPEPPEDLPMSNQVMGPGFSSTFTHRHAGSLDGRAADIEAGRAALYVYGAITYQDAFRKPHVSRYLLFSSGKGALSAGVLSAYPTGNEAD